MKLFHLPIAALLMTALSHAASSPEAKPSESAPAVKGKPAQNQPTENRSKDIRFDNDEVVEGMNKNPLDALESIADQDKGKNNHLYRKKSDFHAEMKAQSSQAGYVP